MLLIQKLQFTETYYFHQTKHRRNIPTGKHKGDAIEDEYTKIRLENQDFQ